MPRQLEPTERRTQWTTQAGGTWLHLDMDSFFATVEQQARPRLRGRPVGISIAPSAGGTIIGSSIEAKARGVGTASRVAEAKLLIPELTILPPNPGRYRTVHRRVRTVMADYAPDVHPRSVDEIAIWLSPDQLARRPALATAAEIKQRVRAEVGEWLLSSIGLGPNWWLAKTASAMRKPDGLLELTRDNTRHHLSELCLTDLCGIAHRMAARFQLAGLPTPVALYDADPAVLQRRFGMAGYYWHRRLHGYQLDTQPRPTRTIGHSSVIPRPTTNLDRLKPLLGKLCERTGRRLRLGGWLAGSVSVFVGLRGSGPGSGAGAGPSGPTGNPGAGAAGGWNRGGWGRWRRTAPFNDSGMLFAEAWGLLGQASRLPAPARLLAVRVAHLRPAQPEQLILPIEPTGQVTRRQRAVAATDRVNDRWGELTIHPAIMLGTEEIAKDSIAFGQDLQHPDQAIRPRPP